MAPEQNMPAQSIETDEPEVSSADLEVMQGEALRFVLDDWLQDLEEEDKSPQPEDSRSLMRTFVEERLDEVFHIIPQALRESDQLLRDRISYLINDILKPTAAQEVEVDDGQRYHQKVWLKMLARARVRTDVVSGLRRYESFIDRHNDTDLLALLEECTDPYIWEHCVVGGKALDPAFLHKMAENWRHQVAGWYLVLMWDEDTEVCEWYRVYVGQAGGGEDANNIQKRIGQHKSSSKNLKQGQLLYRQWRGMQEVDSVDPEKMRQVKAFKLGIAPAEGTFSETADDDLFLCLGEMYFSLIFRSLQTYDLVKWLPEGVAGASDPTPVGLNVALPLSQGQHLEAKKAFGRLYYSTDPDVHAYVKRTLAKNIQKVYDDNFVNLTAAVRATSKWANENVFREGAPGETLRVKCTKCGNVKDDPSPRWVKRTGEYLARDMKCEGSCVPTKSQLAKKQKSASMQHRPVDGAVPWVINGTFYHRLGPANHCCDDWLKYYTGVRAHAPPERRWKR